jgi:hypothetical protein
MRPGHLVAACLLAVISLPLAAQRPNMDPIPVGPIAEKLGGTLMPSTPGELEPGHSATLSLSDSVKISQYGIKNMHRGARVTVTYIGPGRLRVEADEMEPEMRSVKVTLVFAPSGALAVLEDPAAKQPTRLPATSCCESR